MPVRLLQSPADFERYVDFSEEVYRQNPVWIPPDRHHLISVLSGEGQDIAQCRVQPFCVERDGCIVATLTAVVDDVYNRYWNERTGHLLFFEAMQGFETDVAALSEPRPIGCASMVARPHEPHFSMAGSCPGRSMRTTRFRRLFIPRSAVLSLVCEKRRIRHRTRHGAVRNHLHS